ncbi:MAG: efflux RND transporter periplasmic adaptor subunit [Acidobacteriota bacterium]
MPITHPKPPHWPRAPQTIWALLPILALTSGCAKPEAEASPEDDAPIAQLVAVTQVDLEEWFETVELTAELVPWAAVTVAAEVAGRVIELPVDHGDRVRKGEAIARLDTSATEAEKAQAEARLQSARASLEQAQRDLTRGESLSDRDSGILSEDDLDRLRLAKSTGEAGVAEAEAALLRVEETLARMVIKAPFAGTVSERHAEVGSWLAPGTPVVRLVDSSRLKARGAANQIDRLRVGLEAPATVSTDALPGQEFAATLRYLGQEADPATGTYLVEAEVPAESAENPEARLLPGMRGSMTLELGRQSDLLVPRTALVSGALFVIDGGTAVRVAVESEPIGPGRVRVLSGLEPGRQVVVQGQHRLRDGAAVEVRENQEETP